MRIGTFAYLVTGPPHTYFYATYTRTGTAAEVAVSVPYSVVRTSPRQRANLTPKGWFAGRGRCSFWIHTLSPPPVTWF
jgi:hypothetical protein